MVHFSAYVSGLRLAFRLCIVATVGRFLKKGLALRFVCQACLHLFAIQLRKIHATLASGLRIVDNQRTYASISNQETLAALRLSPSCACRRCS